jgi:diguanylate cyclase (GGDEF)-like protein
MAARFGGEEFLMVLPGTDIDAAMDIATSIHTRIRAARIEHDCSPVGPFLTISMGIASVVPQIELTAEDLVSAADKALYQVKATGRNSSGVEPVTPRAR